MKITSLILLLLLSISVFAEEKENYRVRVTTSSGEEMVVTQFTIYNNSRTYFNAEWKGSTAKLSFRDIQKVIFTDRPKSYAADVTFWDGRVDSFKLYVDPFHGKSDFGDWYIGPSKVTALEFNPGVKGDIAETVDPEFDSITMRNGDVISGVVQNTSITLQTSYGVMTFELTEISTISFEGGGSNLSGLVDSVTLKIGDKLSGVVKDNEVQIKLRSGNLVKIDLEKAKAIKIAER